MLKFSYKGYSHGKFLLADKIPKNEPISNFLRSRLDKNRQHLLQNPQDLKPYIPSGKTIRANDLLHQIKTESTFFQTVMDDFELEEKITYRIIPNFSKLVIGVIICTNKFNFL